MNDEHDKIPRRISLVSWNGANYGLLIRRLLQKHPKNPTIRDF